MGWFNHSAATARTIGQARAGRPPRSPKLNGAVERDNHTHTEEFYRVTSCFLGDEPTSIVNSVSGQQSTIPCALTRRSATSPRAVPAADVISKKGMKTVTNLLVVHVLDWVCIAL